MLRWPSRNAQVLFSTGSVQSLLHSGLCIEGACRNTALRGGSSEGFRGKFREELTSGHCLAPRWPSVDKRTW